MDTARINELKDQICDVCHKMWQLGWVAANDGNVSARLDDGTFLCTPTGMSKSFITPEKLLRVDKDLKVLEGQEGLRPSSEMKMHLRCYEKRPDVMCVVHAHPPGATGFAVAHKAVDMYNMIEDVTVIGSVPLTPYGTPSTTEVPDAIEPYLEEHDVMLPGAVGENHHQRRDFRRQPRHQPGEHPKAHRPAGLLPGDRPPPRLQEIRQRIEVKPC